MSEAGKRKRGKFRARARARACRKKKKRKKKRKEGGRERGLAGSRQSGSEGGMGCLGKEKGLVALHTYIHTQPQTHQEERMMEWSEKVGRAGAWDVKASKTEEHARYCIENKKKKRVEVDSEGSAANATPIVQQFPCV